MALEFENYILDNVHGFIGLTEIEDKIEHLVIFQRLRRLKQLGLTNWVFPGAEHTRYSHSLGVMHIIDQMATGLGFDDEDRQILRLAGMLHDIGHYPLSHIGEYAYMATPIKTNFIEHVANKIETAVSALSNFDPLKAVEMVPPPKKYHHENMGVEVINANPDIQRLLEDRFGSKATEVKEDICDIITGNLDRKPELSAKVQLLHSELDADRIDYLLRDASSSGASYGSFEVGALIKCLKMRRHSKFKVDIVGVSPKGIGVADQFMISRFFAYSLVIYHKHSSALQMMAQELINWVAHSGMPDFPKPAELMEWIKTHHTQPNYYCFHDQIFMKILEVANLGRYSCDLDLQKLAGVLEQYKALELAKNRPVIELLGNDRKKLQQDVQAQQLYKDLTSPDYLKGNNRIGIFLTAKVTDHIPYDQFCAAYDPAKSPDSSLEEYLIQRLQNGLALIPDNPSEDPILLVDCPNSMIKDLSLYTRVILREYQLPL